MPKCYSEIERNDIKNRLKQEAAKCLEQYGIRKTTVDELVKRVKIPKGTFYLFYPSKEMLLFEVILEEHEKIDSSLYQAMSSIDRNGDIKEQVTDIIYSFFKLASTSPMFRMINSEEVGILAKKLSPEVLQNHIEDDSSMVEEIFHLLPVRDGASKNSFSAAFRGIYFSTLHNEEIGETYFDDGLKLLVRGLVLQFM